MRYDTQILDGSTLSSNASPLLDDEIAARISKASITALNK